MVKEPSSHTLQHLLTHGILLGPAPGSGLVLAPVCLVHVSDLGHQRVIGIWIS